MGDKLTIVSATVPHGGALASVLPGVSLEKQQQKAVKTRVLEHVGPYLRLLQARLSAPSALQVCYLQPTFACSLDLLSPLAYPLMPASSIGTKFVTSSFFRHRAAINHLVYTPDGRRLLCAGNNGNVSLWNGTNFENELGPGIQAHEASPIRCMTFSHSGLFLLSCDDMGRVKFSKPTLEVLQVYHAHKEPCRSVNFSPTDFKFVTGSDDSTVRVFDTFRGQELSMTGHGGDVRWVDWHPTKGVIASCSKDACVKLWDPRVGTCLSTLHGHKNGIFQVKWNHNGHWLLSCSRDQLMKLYDVRMLREMATFSGHGRDVTCVSWHPQHEELFVSGAIDGSLMMWLASRPDAQGVVPAAHDASVWTTAWHPLGHVLASAGADQKCQFWCRKRPGDIWQDACGHDSIGSSAGTAAALTTGTTVGDGTGVALGVGLTHCFAGGGGGGAVALSVPGMGFSTGPPGLGGAAAPNRPNVIPGIGAVLDQLSTVNLQGLTAMVDLDGGAVTAATLAGGGSGSGSIGTGAWGPRTVSRGAGAKRGREEGPREAPLRFVGRGLEHERDGRREAWGDREWERGPGKVARMDGLGPRGGDSGAGAGTDVCGGPLPSSGTFGDFASQGLPGPGGVPGPGAGHDLWHGTGEPLAHSVTYDGRYDPGSSRSVIGAGNKAEVARAGLQGRSLQPGERIELRHSLHEGPPPPRYPGHEDWVTQTYAQEVRDYGRSGRPPLPIGPRSGRPGSGRPYSGYPQVSYINSSDSGYRDGAGTMLPPHGNFDGYRHAMGLETEGQYTSGSGPSLGPGTGRGRGPYLPNHRAGGPSSMYSPGRGRGRGRSPGW
ncbi:polyadenylation factor I complex [Volvox africanus]|uniref:Polyadenylation factor I complex n=1 Tax=Volvox africanus TaxID=51714 RepID=A0ABQ5S0T0_9CHLO|nr:polyadenylation factor I complex [Volvox africanus]